MPGPDMSQMAPAVMRQRQQMLQLQEAAAMGDPAATQQLQAMQQAQQQPPQQGMPPGGANGMSQSDFGKGQPIPPDVQARRAKQLIELLRARGG